MYIGGQAWAINSISDVILLICFLYYCQHVHIQNVSFVRIMTFIMFSYTIILFLRTAITRLIYIYTLQLYIYARMRIS